MKARYKVENTHIWKGADYIIIGNYHSSNRVCGFYYYYNIGATIKDRATENTIGVWKIKPKQK